MNSQKGIIVGRAGRRAGRAGKKTPSFLKRVFKTAEQIRLRSIKFSSVVSEEADLLCGIHEV
jgi:hypothetical protein